MYTQMKLVKWLLYLLRSSLYNQALNTSWKWYATRTTCAIPVETSVLFQALKEVMTSENLPPPPTHLLEVSEQLEVYYYNWMLVCQTRL